MLAQAAPTVAAVDQLSPAEAGATVLRGKTHAPVEAVAMVEPGHLAPPGFVERDLIEQPVRNGSGCVRRRWRAIFRSPTLERHGPFILDSVYAMTEIVLTGRSACPTTGYVHVNPGIDQMAGLAMLAQVEAVRTGRVRVAFDCKDDTGDAKFCRSRASILQDLATRKSWILSRDGGGFAVSLKGQTRSIVTMQFDPRNPDRVVVTKTYPAPF
ncbi:hypothetical protein ASE65_13325 [Sphingomonas sp. Leaf16]|nr:hypothetical protein ASE65_13325 [Sphingomonas sp. Leaf16]